MESDADLRRELEDAISKVREQIDVQARTPTFIPGFDGVEGKSIALAELQAELTQLEDALKNLN
jgi:hypothetical protein